MDQVKEDNITPMISGTLSEEQPLDEGRSEKMTRGQFLRRAAIALGAVALATESHRLVNTGAAIGVEVPDPFSGKHAGVGVTIENSEDAMGMGLPQDMIDRMRPGPGGGKTYKVRIGSSSATLYVGTIQNPPEGDRNSLMSEVRIFGGADVKQPSK